MPVKTPELDVKAYQPMEAPPPVPEMPTNNPLPTSAGYVSKGGAGAFIASNIINGYLKGRQHAAEVKQQKATSQIAGADYTYKTMADNYNQLLRNGKSETDPDVQKAKQAANEAWQASLGVKAQYVMPQDDGKKKGVKEKTEGILKGVFGKEGIQPHVIPAAALAALKTSPPPGLGLSLEDKAAMQQQETAKFQLDNMKTEAAQRNEQFAWIKDDEKRKTTFRDLSSKDPASLSLGEQQQLHQLTRLAAIEKDPVHGAQDMDLTQKIMSGAHMSAGELQTAQARGLMQGPHIEQHTNSKGMDELITVDPATGAVIGRSSLGRHYTNNEALSNAIAIDKFRQKQQFEEIKKAMPGANDSQVYQIMATENAKHPEYLAAMIGDNPEQKGKDLQAVNTALKTVWGEYYNLDSTKAKDTAARRDHDIIQNFINTPDKNQQDGTFAFKKSIVPTGQKTVHWHLFGPNETAPTYQGNATPQEMQAAASSLYSRTRAALQKQGKGKYSEADLDRMLPKSYSDISGYAGMPNGPLEKPPAASGSSSQKPSAYKVTINGQSQVYAADQITEEMAAEAKARGVNIEPINYSVP